MNVKCDFKFFGLSIGLSKEFKIFFSEQNVGTRTKLRVGLFKSLDYPGDHYTLEDDNLSVHSKDSSAIGP